jgi:hypothetical protein
MLLLFSVYNVYQGWKSTKALNAKARAGDEIMPELSMGQLRYPLTGFLFIAAYLIAMPFIGFFISSAVFLVAFICYLGYRRIPVILAIVFGLEGFIYFLFVKMLMTRLPAGIFF